MTNPPEWTHLAWLARTALSRIISLRAVVGLEGTDAGWSQRRVTFSQPDRWRIEDQDGPIFLRGYGTQVRRDADGMRQEAFAPIWFPDRGEELDLGLTWGHPQAFLATQHYSRQVGPIEPVTVAGRSAWEVRLDHEEERRPLIRATFDAETGLVLRLVGEDEPAFHVEVLSLQIVDEALPADLFTWDGPTLPELPASAELAYQQGIEVTSARQRLSVTPESERNRWTMGFREVEDERSA